MNKNLKLFMEKKNAQYKSVDSPDFGKYTLIMIPDLKDSDITENPALRKSFDESFGPNWLVVWKSPHGLPTYVTNANTRNITQTEVEKRMDGEWKTKEIEF